MDIPRGNPLFEEKELAFADIRTLLDNLEQEGITGYVNFLNENSKLFIFFNHGRMVRSFEAKKEGLKANLPERLINRIKGKSITTSVYILSSMIVGVLSNFFAYNSLYLDYSAKRKEFNRIMDGLEKDEYSGIVQVIASNQNNYLILDHGKIVLDEFAENYAQIICGTGDYNKLLNLINTNPVKVNVLGERAKVVDDKRKNLDDNLNKMKQLSIKKERSMFSGGLEVKVDEYLLHEWRVKPGGHLQVEVETADGNSYIFKCGGVKKLGSYIAFSKNVLAKYKFQEGQPVTVKPVAED